MLRFPTEGYRDLKEDCPDIPADTCPLIDKTLKHVTEIEINLEQLRDQNEALRDVGKFWRATAIRLLEECCDLNRYIKKRFLLSYTGSFGVLYFKNKTFK